MSLRILVVAPDYPPPVVGGLQKQAHELNQQLVKMGCEVLVLSCKHVRDGHSEEVVDGICVRRAPFWGKLRTRLVINAFWTVIQILVLARRYDVVHIHNLSTIGAVAAVAARLCRVPVVMKLPNVGEMGIPGLRSYAFGDGILVMLKAVDAFVAMSEASVDELREVGTPNRKIFRMVNGINLASFDSAKGEYEQLEASSEKLNIVFTGRLVATKGLDSLFHAIAELVETGEIGDAKLSIVGTGPELENLKNLAGSLSLSNYIEFLGYRPDIPRILAGASVFVLPSHAEGNSNSILEAMSASLPVVSTDVGGTRMLLGARAGEYVVAPGDSKALANCLRRLIGNPQLRAQLGQEMRQRIEDHFDICVVASGYHSAYSALKNARYRCADMTPLSSSAFDL